MQRDAPTSDLTLPQPVYKEEEQGEREYGCNGTADETQADIRAQVVTSVAVQYGAVQTDELAARVAHSKRLTILRKQRVTKVNVLKEFLINELYYQKCDFEHKPKHNTDC